MAYEGSFRIYVFPTIVDNMSYVPAMDMQLGCHTLIQPNLQFEKMLKEYPERRIWLIQGFVDDTDYVEKVVAIA